MKPGDRKPLNGPDKNVFRSSAGLGVPFKHLIACLIKGVSMAETFGLSGKIGPPISRNKMI